MKFHYFAPVLLLSFVTQSNQRGFMYKIQKYRVVPSLPSRLSFLHELAYNLYWSWDHDVKSLFHRMDAKLFEKSNQNPALFLGLISQKRLESLAKDDGFLSHLDRVQDNLQSYLSRKTWFKKSFKNLKDIRIAYFSMEYGITKAIPIYSGGLGVLASDHLKSASDLGLPMIGVGLLYQHGYFHQYLVKDGWQKEIYPKNDFYNMPIKLKYTVEGNPILIDLDFPERKVYAQIWQAQIGRIPLFLLDTNIPQNGPEDRMITDQLYGGDCEMRIKQEILVGIGGIRALNTLGLFPDVCHMNEGHSAFMALERMRLLVNEFKLSFQEALEITKGGNVFTSHTPVPAGIDEFDPYLIDLYLGSYYKAIGLSQQDFHKLGGVHLHQTGGKFNMAIFALHMAGICNGVSKLHGEVARKMWNYQWPEFPEHEVPIIHITNGIHIRTWISHEMSELFNRYLGPKWHQEPADPSLWNQLDQIPDEELWRAHCRCRTHLVSFARHRLLQQLATSNASTSEIEKAKEVLNPDALTIGFARRFAQYKRAYLLFKDIDRLHRLLSDKERPLQIIIAGKAHPRDNIGKGIIRDIINLIRNNELYHKIVFIEDYDMEIAASLLQGVDIWLNTPRRPREASGTSGMKAGVNGALNLSILDGWWDEAYVNDMGWAIGLGENYTDPEEQDRVESEALYHLLEQEIIPLFYNHGNNTLPRSWIKMVKNSMKSICPTFNTDRMVRAYLQETYIPAAHRWGQLTKDNMEIAKILATWKKYFKDHWNSIKIVGLKMYQDQEIKVGQQLQVIAEIEMDGLQPEDIRVEIYYGPLDEKENIEQGHALPMTLTGQSENGSHSFVGFIPCEVTGQHGLSVRVLPYHAYLANPYEMRLMKWHVIENQ
jgi:glycogen phosphorylase